MKASIVHASAPRCPAFEQDRSLLYAFQYLMLGWILFEYPPLRVGQIFEMASAAFEA